jgi:hypothetical protein
MDESSRTAGGHPMLGTQTVMQLEGSKVSVALSNGDRLDDCQLVAAPRGNTSRLWLFTAGIDLFVPLADVVAMWETGCPYVPS